MPSCCSEVRILVCIIVVLFGMGSWIAINGLWVELPILVDQLPEGWNLPSYMTVIIQIANIGPIAVTIAHVCWPGKVNEQPIVYAMVLVGSVAAILLAFFWRKTTVVAEVERSIAFLALMFIIALGDCTSSVVFLPFMNIFKPQYMTLYFIGEGFSGLLPSLVSLGQGVGKLECHNVSSVKSITNSTEYSTKPVYLAPFFSASVFFVFIFAMMITCGISFIMLNNLPYCKGEHVTESTEVNYFSEAKSTLNHSVKRPEVISIAYSSKIRIDEDISNEFNNNKLTVSKSDKTITGAITPSSVKMSRYEYAYFLVLTGWMNTLSNGILPSVQSFACLPYGSQTYHLAVTLSNIANPLACLIVFFLPVKSRTNLGAITTIGTLVSVYIMSVAANSPEPPLVNSLAGSLLVVSIFHIILHIAFHIELRRRFNRIRPFDLK